MVMEPELEAAAAAVAAEVAEAVAIDISLGNNSFGLVNQTSLFTGSHGIFRSIHLMETDSVNFYNLMSIQ